MARDENQVPTGDENDKFFANLQRTVQDFLLFGEPQNIVQWLQELIISCAGSGSIRRLSAVLKYRRKFRLKLDWANREGETAIIRAWRLQHHEVVKVIH